MRNGEWNGRRNWPTSAKLPINIAIRIGNQTAAILNLRISKQNKVLDVSGPTVKYQPVYVSFLNVRMPFVGAIFKFSANFNKYFFSIKGI